MNYCRRYYDPRNGRFIGRDPIAEEEGINLYAFCGNNPVDRWDRLGMDTMYYDGSGGYSGGLKGVSDISFMNLLRNYTDQDYPEGIDAGASFGYVGTKHVGGNRTAFTLVVTNRNGTSTVVRVTRDQLARADQLSLGSVLATGVTVAAGANGPGRADVTIGPLQPYTGPNEGAFYIPVPGDVPSNVEGILRDPNINPGEICIQCHGVSAFGFSGNVNDFAGLSAIPGSGPNAQQGYSTIVTLSEAAVAMFGTGTAGGIARVGAVSALPDGLGIGIVQEGRVVVADLTVSTSHEALAARVGLLGADGTLTGGAQAITWTVENGVIRTTASINFPSQTGAATEQAVEQFLQALIKASGGGG